MADDRDSPAQEAQFPLRGEFVPLCDLLKLLGWAGSGGQGKALVASGAVSVDGQPELRKTAKIRAGQVVEWQGRRVHVVAAATAGGNR